MFFEELRGNFSEILRSGDCGVKWKIEKYVETERRKKQKEKFKMEIYEAI